MNLTQKDLSNFSATEYFAPEQLITIKGKVVSVSPVKSLNTQRSGRHNEQQVTTTDTTSSRYVSFGRNNYFNSLDVNKTI